eukprot:PhF_6_TR30749/c0_g1_i1/m.45271
MLDVMTLRNTYQRRRFKCNVGWCQDVMQAALLGLRKEVRSQILQRLESTVKGQRPPWNRFPYFSPAFHDEYPNMEHLSVLHAAVQYSILDWVQVVFQHDENTDGRRQRFELQVLSAWPCEWDVDVKLMGPAGTIVYVQYSIGRKPLVEVVERESEELVASSSDTVQEQPNGRSVIISSIGC